MTKTLGALIIVMLLVGGCRLFRSSTESELEFYGADSRRAKMSFDAHVLMSIPEADRALPADILAKKYGDRIDELVRIQLAHMFGAFTQHTEPFNFYESPGIPREKPKVTKAAGASKTDNKLRVDFKYTDIVVFEKSLFTGDQSKKIKFFLPREPGPHGLTVYQRSCPEPQLVPEACALVELSGIEYNESEEGRRWFKTCKKLEACKGGALNHCTDLHYNTLGDYWYFWNPRQADESGECQLDPDELLTVTATLKPMRSTAGTWPDYHRLYGWDEEGKKKLRITYLVGVDHDFDQNDLGVKTFKNSHRLLIEGQDLLDADDAETFLTPFEREMLEDDADIKFTHSPGSHSNETNHKALQWENDTYKVLLNMYLFDPNDTKTLKKLAVDGLRNSDIFIYNGHSGLGGYFDVGGLFFHRRFTLYSDTYQIFFFNGCSTFSYYNADYHDLKGTLNLDIVTNGIGAPYLEGAGNDVWLIRKLVSGERPSWQKIMNQVYTIAPLYSALTHVNGDEDNPRKPKGVCSDDENQFGYPKTCECKRRPAYKYNPRTGMCRINQ